MYSDFDPNYKVCFTGKLRASRCFHKGAHVSRRNVQNLHPLLVLWKLTHHLTKNRSHIYPKIQSTSVVFSITYKVYNDRWKEGLHQCFFQHFLLSRTHSFMYLFLFFMLVCTYACWGGNVCACAHAGVHLSVRLPMDTRRA